MKDDAAQRALQKKMQENMYMLEHRRKVRAQKRSKFEIRDRHRGAPLLNFIPKRKETLFEKKVPTHEQFRKEIEHLGNIDVYYKGKKRFSRGM